MWARMTVRRPTKEGLSPNIGGKALFLCCHGVRLRLAYSCTIPARAGDGTRTHAIQLGMLLSFQTGNTNTFQKRAEIRSAVARGLEGEVQAALSSFQLFV